MTVPRFFAYRTLRFIGFIIRCLNAKPYGRFPPARLMPEGLKRSETQCFNPKAAASTLSTRVNHGKARKFL